MPAALHPAGRCFRIRASVTPSCCSGLGRRTAFANFTCGVDETRCTRARRSRCVPRSHARVSPPASNPSRGIRSSPRCGGQQLFEIPRTNLPGATPAASRARRHAELRRLGVVRSKLMSRDNSSSLGRRLDHLGEGADQWTYDGACPDGTNSLNDTGSIGHDELRRRTTAASRGTVCRDVTPPRATKFQVQACGGNDPTAAETGWGGQRHPRAHALLTRFTTTPTAPAWALHCRWAPMSTSVRELYAGASAATPARRQPPTMLAAAERRWATAPSSSTDAGRHPSPTRERASRDQDTS